MQLLNINNGSSFNYLRVFIPVTGPRKSPVLLFFVTPLPESGWVIYVPGAFLGCGSHFLGFLPGIEPWFPVTHSQHGMHRKYHWKLIGHIFVWDFSAAIGVNKTMMPETTPHGFWVGLLRWPYYRHTGGHQSWRQLNSTWLFTVIRLLQALMLLMVISILPNLLTAWYSSTLLSL